MTIYAIDNWYGDQRPGSPGTPPTYGGNWDPPMGNCPSCDPAKSPPGPRDIDVTQLYNQTWRSVTIGPSEPPATVSVTFNGTWVGVFCLLPPGLGITTFTNVTFMLDNELVGEYLRPTSTASSWTYNFSMFSSAKLEAGLHTLVVQPQGEANTSFFLLDYIAYDFDDVIRDTASTSSNIAETSLPIGPAAISTLSAGTDSINLSTGSDGAMTTLYISVQTTSASIAASIPDNPFTTLAAERTGSFSGSPSDSTNLSSSVESRQVNTVLLATSIGGSLGGLCLVLFGLLIWSKRRKNLRIDLHPSPQRDTSLSSSTPVDTLATIPSSKKGRTTGGLRDSVVYLHNMRYEKILRLLARCSSASSRTEGILEVDNSRREAKAETLEVGQIRCNPAFDGDEDAPPPSYIA